MANSNDGIRVYADGTRTLVNSNLGSRLGEEACCRDGIRVFSVTAEPTEPTEPAESSTSTLTAPATASTSTFTITSASGQAESPQGDGIRIFTTKKFQRHQVDPGLINKPSVQVYDLSSTLIIGNKLRKIFKPRDKARILAYRNDVDMYTGMRVDPRANLSVDHIYEVQCMTHVIAKAFHDRPIWIRDKLVPELRKAINIIDNLNVTTLSLNCSKMNAFKWFLRDDMYMAYPLETFLLETKCFRHVDLIEKAVKQAYASIRLQIVAIRTKPEFSQYTMFIDDVLREYDLLMTQFRFGF